MYKEIKRFDEIINYDPTNKEIIVLKWVGENEKGERHIFASCMDIISKKQYEKDLSFNSLKKRLKKSCSLDDDMSWDELTQEVIDNNEAEEYYYGEVIDDEKLVAKFRKTLNMSETEAYRFVYGCSADIDSKFAPEWNFNADLVAEALKLANNKQ